jgi:hypothetical protein
MNTPLERLDIGSSSFHRYLRAIPKFCLTNLWLFVTVKIQLDFCGPAVPAANLSAGQVLGASGFTIIENVVIRNTRL